jgi:hypothetical protein
MFKLLKKLLGIQADSRTDQESPAPVTAFRYGRNVKVRKGRFLPNTKTSGLKGMENVVYSGQGRVDFPLPEKPEDPVWVRLKEPPQPIIPYERHELHLR